LKNPQAAHYGVKNRLKMLVYWRVHSAFSPILALSCTRLSLFNGLLALAMIREDRLLLSLTID